MNGNEHEANDMQREPNDAERLHQMLCATILGEASEEERAEVARALESSPELRAERARLEATIGLVLSTMDTSAELSPQAASVLAAAAAKRRQVPWRPWHRTGAFRIAASIAVVGVGFALWRSSQREAQPFTYSIFGKAAARDDASGMRVARLEPKNRPAAELRSAPEQGVLASEAKALRELGYADEGERAQTHAESPVQPEVARAHESQGAAEVSLGVPLTNAPVSVPAASDADKKALADAIAQQMVPEPPKSGLVGADFEQADAGAGNYRTSLDNVIAAVPVPAPSGAESVLYMETIDARGKESNEGTSVAGGTVPSGPASPGPSGLTSGSAVSHRAVGGGKGRAGGAVTGVATPGPRSPSSAPAIAPAPEPLRALGYTDGDEDHSDDFFLGRREGEARARENVAGEKDGIRDGVQLERLRKLGYIGDDRAAGERYGFDHGAWLRDCRRRPNERPRDMFFRFWGDNAFELAAADRQSTFSIDVDTASYALARRYLVDGHLPTKAQVRTEEFVNYFKADVPAPTEQTFAIATELAPSLFGGVLPLPEIERLKSLGYIQDGKALPASNTWMLRVAIRGKEVARTERQPLALTFVIDVSGSMKEESRLELVKHSMRLLLGELDARDALSIVKFSNDAALVLPMTSAGQRALIESAVHPLQPEGSTNTEAGLRMGYEQALASLVRGATNRVVLLTDGVANVGITDPGALTSMVERQRKAGIYLNTIGVGMDNHNDVLLEQLADKGDGLCNYVDDEAEARRALVENFTGAFEPIARDVKVQVEFDPAQVEHYRLLGYENRAVADQDFRNDAVDAGEIGAGHQVIALYELVRTNSSGDGPLATVRLRWKPPHVNGVANVESDAAQEIEQPVLAKDAAGSFGTTSAGYRISALVAQFAEFLRRSIHARSDSLDQLIVEARKLAGEVRTPEVAELVAMIEKSKALLMAELGRYGEVERCYDELRRGCWLRAQLEDLRRGRGDAKLDEIGREADELERRLQELEGRLRTLDHDSAVQLLLELERENLNLQQKIGKVLRGETIPGVR